MPTPTPVTLAERELWAEVVALEELLEIVPPGKRALNVMDAADLDALDRALRRVLLRIAHLVAAREEG